MRREDRDEALATLRTMTKEEIITWLSGEVGMLFRPPSKSSLLFSRYQAASNAVMARREENVLDPEVAKKLDGFNAELNKTKGFKEFAAIAKRAEPYQKKWNKWIAETTAISAEDAKVNAMWDAYMEQSEKESPTPTKSRSIAE